MEYKFNESLYIRKENDGKENMYFVYVGEEDEMYKLNEASFEVYTMIENKYSIADICKKLQTKYCDSTSKMIEEKVYELLDTFINLKILEQIL